MSELVMRRRLSGLEPIDDTGREALKSVGVGDLVKVKITRPRNQRHHALFWALVTLVHQNMSGEQQQRYPTVEAFVDALKVLTGHAEWFWLPDGREVVRPKSIAFHKMDQTAFSAFFDACCTLIGKHWLPGVTSEELRREAESMLGLRRAA